MLSLRGIFFAGPKAFEAIQIINDYFGGLAPFLFNMVFDDERVAGFSRYVE